MYLGVCYAGVGGCDELGRCVFINKPNGSSCTDSNACTVGDHCSYGTCVGSPRTCTDGNPCTTDACNPPSGCTFPKVPDGTACGDGNACNGLETCQSKVCTAGPAPICDDGNACTVDSCDAGSGCVHACQTLAECPGCAAPQCTSIEGGACVCKFRGLCPGWTAMTGIYDWWIGVDQSGSVGAGWSTYPGTIANFRFLQLGGTSVAIMAADGRYWTTNQSGGIVATATTVGPHETFQLLGLGDRFQLAAWDGTFVTATMFGALSIGGTLASEWTVLQPQCK